MPKVKTRTGLDKNWQRQRNKVFLAFFGVAMFMFLAIATAIMTQTQQDSRTQAKSNSDGPVYAVATWVCNDGKKSSSQSKSCKSRKYWEKKATSYCRRRKGLKDFSVEQLCNADIFNPDPLNTPTPQPTGISSCVDSDGGRNIYVKGVTSGIEWGGDKAVSESDFCVSGGSKDGRLAEFYCRDGRVTSKSYRCKYGCRDGACLKKDQPSPTPQPTNQPPVPTGTPTPYPTQQPPVSSATPAPQR